MAWVSYGIFGNECTGMLSCHVITGLVSSCIEAEMIAGVLNYACAYHSSLSVVLTWIVPVPLVSLKLPIADFLGCNLLKVTKFFLLINKLERTYKRL